MLSKLIAHDENIFFLPSISSVIKSSKDFDKVAHCTITDGVVDYYKTHMGAALTSKSLAKVGSILTILILIKFLKRYHYR